MLQLISRTGFEQAVRKHGAERHARVFSSWGQLVTMLFWQLGGVYGHLFCNATAGGVSPWDRRMLLRERPKTGRMLQPSSVGASAAR